MAKTTPVTRAKLEAVARRAALAGAAITVKYYEKGLTPQYKGDVNLVTKADLESQKAVVKILHSAFPSHDILAEEQELGHGKDMKGPIWICDPLDGTTNYAHGYPLYAVSLAYREGGETLLGLTYLPILKELFIAHRGKGATRNGKKIHVSKANNLSRSLLATGFPYDRRTSEDNNLNYFSYFEMAAQCVRRSGAATVDLAYVACGRFEGFWEQRLAPWDIVAGMLMVEEAGGKISDFRGRLLTDLTCGEIVASNTTLHPAIVNGIFEARKYPIPGDIRRIRLAY